MKIGEVAQRSQVPIKTIRYYEEIGVLSAPPRTASGYRDHGEEVVNRLRFIRASQSIGLTLGEIRGIVAFREQGEVPCAHVLDLLRNKARDIDVRIAELKQARAVLRGLVSRARDLRPEDCSPESVCHLIPRANGNG